MNNVAIQRSINRRMALAKVAEAAGDASVNAAGRAVSVPVEDIERYLAEYKAIKDAPTHVPLLGAFRRRRRLNALYRAFATAHGFDPGKQLYMHPGSNSALATQARAL